MKSETASIKTGIGGFRASHKAKKEKIRKENQENGKALKSFWADSRRSTAVLAHNGIVALIWAAAMFLTAYIDLQVAFFAVAFILGQTGGILMQTSVDVITVYVTIVMGCGFCLFFGLAIEKALIRAMGRRLWKNDKASGSIDKGDLWRERHPAEPESLD